MQSEVTDPHLKEKMLHVADRLGVENFPASSS
jgi:hypothetical protein